MKQPLARSEKQLFWLSGGALALFGGVAWLYNGNRAPEIPAPLALPAPNGFDLYAASAGALVPAVPPVDEVNDANFPSLTPAQRAARYSSIRRRAWLAANGKSWALLSQARAAKTRHPNTRNNIMAPMPYGIMREMARAKMIEAKDFKSLNQWNRALNSGLDSVEMGHDIERGAPLIGSLVGIAIQAIGAASVADVPPHLNALEARAGVKRLENLIKNAETPANVLREEKWTMMTQVQSASSTVLMPLQGQTARSIGAMIDEFVREISKPFALQTTPPKPTGWLNVYAAILYDVFPRYNFNVARRSATEEQLLLRLALRAYQLENGAYPASLNQLAPKYLIQIPRDPFGRGEPWRYRKVGKTYLAWSIGPDGIDNKGVSIPKKPGSKRLYIDNKSAGDWVAKP